jgi:hypothetical protein
LNSPKFQNPVRWLRRDIVIPTPRWSGVSLSPVPLFFLPMAGEGGKKGRGYYFHLFRSSGMLSSASDPLDDNPINVGAGYLYPAPFLFRGRVPRNNMDDFTPSKSWGHLWLILHQWTQTRTVGRVAKLPDTFLSMLVRGTFTPHLSCFGVGVPRNNMPVASSQSFVIITFPDAVTENIDIFEIRASTPLNDLCINQSIGYSSPVSVTAPSSLFYRNRGEGEDEEL